jgi:hypothetical protein
MIPTVPPIQCPLRHRGYTPVLVALCSLLLLLPVFNGSIAGPIRSINSESEESRQPCEEERSSENSIQHRLQAGRTVEQRSADRTAAGRCGVTRCRPAGRAGLIPPAEHRFRNGCGAPLRC